MKRKLLLAASLLGLFSVNSSAQNYLGVHSSNYVGVMGLDNQPASFVDGRFKFDLNLFSVNAGFWNNGKYFDTRDMPGWWKKSFTTDTSWMGPSSTFDDRYFGDIRNYKDPSARAIGVYTNYQADLINFAFHITPKIAVGFSAKTRMVGNVDQLDPKLGKLIEENLDFVELWNLKLNEKLVNVNVMAWNEYGLNYGQVIRDQDQHFFKIGGRVKLLQGLASAYAYTDNLSYELLNKDTATTLQGSFEYGYSDGLDKLSAGNKFDPFRSDSKLGVGLDIGLVYEWRPDYKEYQYEMDGEQNLWRKDKEKYKLRAGVSVLDIGGMKFTKGGRSRDFSVNTTTLDLRIFQDVKSMDEFDHVLDSLLTNDPGWRQNENAGKTYYMWTPTTLSLQLDYNIYKYFYINATGQINVLSKHIASKTKVPTQFVVTPSFDYAWFGMYLPVSVNQYSGWKAGLAARLGPLTVGFTDFRSMFAFGKVRGGEFYAGLRVPVLYGAPDDRDKDKVSDKKDDCPDVPGLWAFKGCPDTDGDGIPDARDLCPEIAGTEEFQGCPDRDGDKIPDKDDECPDVAGLAIFRGCPDTDNDSITDAKDDCPEVFGLKEFNGCPDTDGDGLKDSDDDCPEIAGPVATKGCPDTDGDGTLDKDDLCPLVFGPLETKGCPYPDTDGDGIFDKDDACPTLKGVPENKGCPKIEVEEQEILNTAFENLEFNSGNAVIKATSYASLDELAALLIRKKEWKLQIAGHTDNVGDDKKNLILSKKRAEAVKAYLVKKGVEPKRLNTLYFGETQPLVSNDTWDGRQKNRRVEMTVIFQ